MEGGRLAETWHFAWRLQEMIASGCFAALLYLGSPFS